MEVTLDSQSDYCLCEGSRDITVRTITANGQEQGRTPDVGVVVASEWNSNPLAYAALVTSIPLAVEVISANWEDDYVDKLDEYQRLGIPEYWLVNYLAIAFRAYLGNPKVPTVFALKHRPRTPPRIHD